MGCLRQARYEQGLAVPFKPVFEGEFADVLPIGGSGAVQVDAMGDVLTDLGLVLGFKTDMQGLSAGCKNGFDTLFAFIGNADETVAKGCACAYLKTVVKATHRRDAAGKGEDGNMAGNALLLEPFLCIQPHLGAYRRINAKMAVNFAGHYDQLPFADSISVDAGAGDVSDIIDILVKRDIETL